MATLLFQIHLHTLTMEALCLQRLPHATKSNALNNHELINTILAALTTEATLLDTSKSKNELAISP